MNRNEKIILMLMAAVNFTHILDFMIMMPLGNFLMPYFDIDAGAFSRVVAAYNFAAFVTGILASFVVDHFDRKTVLVFGYAGFLIGTLLCALAPTFLLLMGARIIAGLFGGLIGAQVLSIVADLVPYERRGRAMGWLMAAFSLASVIGVPLGLYLARFFNWHAPFYFIVIIGLIVFAAIIKYVPSITGHLNVGVRKINVYQTLHTIFSVPTQRAALLLSGSIMMGHFMIIPFINPFMEYNVGFTREQTPLIYMVGGATTIISGILWGRLADHYGKLRIFLISGILSLIPILLITNMPKWPFAWVLLPFAFWFGMANGRTITLQAMVSQVVQPESRGSFMSFNSSMQQLFTGGASLLAGWIVYSDSSHRIFNYPVLGFISAGIIAVCMLLALRLKVK
ncbi:MAG: MFS transporter [Chitinophagaceae bacterium]|nr:MFS transporter [Chitinophagaceae bacterium]